MPMGPVLASICIPAALCLSVVLLLFLTVGFLVSLVQLRIQSSVLQGQISTQGRMIARVSVS